MTCPECGFSVFMRAVRLVELHARPRWLALFMEPVAESLVGYHAVCANCGTSVRADAQGVRRLRPAAQPEAVATPVRDPDARPPRAPDVNRTPGLQWSRDPR